MKLNGFERYLKNLLNPDNNPVKDPHANGLQVRGKEDVLQVAFGVSASMEFFYRAYEWGADACIVHHGLDFYAHKNCIPDTVFHNRLKFLFQNDMSLFGFHYLLDSHKEVGNSATVLEILNMKPDFPFGHYDGTAWGWGGNLKKPTNLDDVYPQVNDLFYGNATLYAFGNKEISTIGIVTGSGAFSINEAREKNIDLIITGDVKEGTQELCRELEINLIFGGHYITETFGVKALMESVKYDLGLQTEYFDITNRS